MLRFFARVKGKQGQFARNVLTLMTGTTIAQAIPLAAMPILTRLYEPEDFGVLALYMSVAAMISVVATARYELAVMLPEKNDDAASLVVLAISIAAVISFVLFILVLAFNEPIQGFFGVPAIGPWLYLLPVSVFVAGLWQSLNYWNNRAANFRRLAVSRMVQGGGMTSAQLGLSSMAGGGLILGYIVGQAVAASVFLSKKWGEDRAILHAVTLDKIRKNAKEYIKFPKYSCAGALLDNAAIQMPVLILSKFNTAHVVGVFSLMFRALNLPMSLISAALSQVLFQKLVGLHREAPERLFGFVLKVFIVLLMLMVPLVLVVWFLGPELFSFVFGEAWRDAGGYAAILIFAVAIRFAVSPLSMVLAMEHNVRMGTLWQCIYFVTIISTLYIFKGAELGTFILAFTVHEISLYFLYFCFILLGTKQHSFR
ncbi:lipopolysaccharide biosynthesis protein [Pseudomonas sp. Marseille-Q5299]|uniref:lipopolysaccharide biosynthesis protein n=1 Tax=Pseudomonas sp. Marseille-Q5299 TaxID=2942201 RepID=UPI0033653469